MFSNASSKNDRGKVEEEEKKAFLDNKSKSSMSNETISKGKATDETKSVKNLSSVTSVASIGRRGPKMSDGTEFDTGPYGWIFSIVYLFVLWGLSIVAAIAIVYFNFSRLDPKYPHYFGDGSFLGSVPQVTFEPNPRRFSEGPKNLMTFNIYDQRSYLNMLIRYKHILKNYTTNDGKDEEYCDKKGLTNEQGCKFDKESGFEDCKFNAASLEEGFGFSKGQPCIMLRVNKIIGWKPQLEETQCPDNNRCCGKGFGFTCTSNDDLQFTYYPAHGIQSCYFPYANQPGYEQPFVMAKVSNMTVGKEITIECRPDLSSIKEVESGKSNEVRFHLKMDKTSILGKDSS